MKVLSCKCGDCLHWEIIDEASGTSIKCKTCEEVFPVTIAVPIADKLEWVNHVVAKNVTERRALSLITITQADHDQLVSDQAFLEALQAAGVDNWDGYDEAREAFAESTR